MLYIYKHTQWGMVVWVAIAIPILISIVPLLLSQQLGKIFPWILIAGIIVTLLFGSLTVAVDRQQIKCWFGLGLVHQSFPLAQITNAAVVKNPWYYGWGVRLTPRGWMFNVSGFHAVEIELNATAYFRIGTDEPQALLAAIREGAGLPESAPPQS